MIEKTFSFEKVKPLTIYQKCAWRNKKMCWETSEVEENFTWKTIKSHGYEKVDVDLKYLYLSFWTIKEQEQEQEQSQ